MDILDIASYIVKYSNCHDYSISMIKLQKLLFLCYNNYYHKYGMFLFKERPINDSHGPVFKSLYYINDLISFLEHFQSILNVNSNALIEFNQIIDENQSNYIKIKSKYYQPFGKYTIL